MVIETYLAGPGPAYERFQASGRMLPDGLRYIESWVDADGAERCFQLMETDDPATFADWTNRWDDLVSFEIIPVMSSDQASTATR